VSIVANIDTTWQVNDQLEVDSTGASWSATYGTAAISLVTPIPDFISVEGTTVKFAPTVIGNYRYTVK